MRYNGLNNMFFPLCLINDNHSVTSPSHTKKTKSDNYSGNDSNLLIVFYVQIMPDDFVMQLHRF